MEGKIYQKFNMKPHHENSENYGKLCRERTNKYMTKSRQIQVQLHLFPGWMLAYLYSHFDVGYIDFLFLVAFEPAFF